MKDMLVRFALPPMLALLTATVAAAQTPQFATAAEAKAMLDKAVAALRLTGQRRSGPSTRVSSSRTATFILSAPMPRAGLSRRTLSSRASRSRS